MTTATDTLARTSPMDAVTHALVITRRNVLRNVRLPQLLFFATVQPVMFLLLFNYVFGGAIAVGDVVPGGEYINWIIPGILLQSAIFGATQTGLGLTEDLASGIIERFRSLPMARSAVLAGRTTADLLRNTFVNLLMLAVGVLLGFRVQNGLGRAALGVALALLFGWAMSWVMGTIGLAVKTPEAAQTAGFLPIFPLTFASSIFVPTQSMPAWLQVFAENQPITVLANTVRELFLGGDFGGSVALSLAWTAGIVLVFAPLAVRLYRRAVS